MDLLGAHPPAGRFARSNDPASNRRKSTHRRGSVMPLHEPRRRLRPPHYAPEGSPARILQKRQTIQNRPNQGSPPNGGTFPRSDEDLRERQLKCAYSPNLG